MWFPTLFYNTNYTSISNLQLSSYKQRQHTPPSWQMMPTGTLLCNTFLPSPRNVIQSSVNKPPNIFQIINHGIMPLIWNLMLPWRNVAFIISHLSKPSPWKNTSMTTFAKDISTHPSHPLPALFSSLPPSKALLASLNPLLWLLAFAMLQLPSNYFMNDIFSDLID